MRVTQKNTQQAFYRLAKFNFLTLKKSKYIGMVSVLAVGSVLMFFIIGPFALIFTAMAAAYVPLSLLIAKNRVTKAFAKNPAFSELVYEFDFDETNEESFRATVTRTEKGKGKDKIKKKETVVPYYTVLRACKDKDLVYLYFSESTVIVPLTGVEGGTGKDLEKLLKTRISSRFTTGKIDYTALKAEIESKQKEKAQAAQKTQAAPEKTPSETAQADPAPLVQENPLPTEEENTLPLAEEKE